MVGAHDPQFLDESFSTVMVLFEENVRGGWGFRGSHADRACRVRCHLDKEVQTIESCQRAQGITRIARAGFLEQADVYGNDIEDTCD